MATSLLEMAKLISFVNCHEYKTFLQLQKFRRNYLVYKNGCLKFLRPILKKVIKYKFQNIFDRSLIFETRVA